MKQLLALLFQLVFFSTVLAQEKPVRFQHITAKDGLSQGHVLCMIKNSKGYICTGTYFGLNRYDGYNFDVFHANADDPNSLFIGVLFSLFENSSGLRNNSPLSKQLTAMPPFYQSVWFRLLIVLILLGITVTIYRIRLIRQVRQNRILANKIEERTYEIQQKNKELEKIATDLQKSNSQLEERQQQIEEQSKELAKQRDDLILSNATKDKLFSIIAHDLKNPFNVILGYTDLLLVNHDKWPNDKSLYFLGLLKETSENAYRLLENLLQWSRSQSGTIKFNPKAVRISNVIDNSIEEVKTLAEKKELEIISNLGEISKLSIKADNSMLSLVLRNLLTNAIKFSNKKSQIHVNVSQTNSEMALFEIKDFGVGIPASTISKLFKPGSNNSSFGTEGEKGTGLGLILCHEFVAYHEGEIWATSNPGKETSFFFTIPLAD